jgi:hypothetical protein
LGGSKAFVSAMPQHYGESVEDIKSTDEEGMEIYFSSAENSLGERMQFRPRDEKIKYPFLESGSSFKMITRQTMFILLIVVGCGVLKAGELSPKEIIDLIQESNGEETSISYGSGVVINAFGVDQVAKIGDAAVPSIVKVMEDGNNDFDIFVRCYATCCKILGDRGKIHWSGGVSIIETELGTKYKFPSNMHFESESSFRNRVVADVKRNFSITK